MRAGATEYLDVPALKKRVCAVWALLTIVGSLCAAGCSGGGGSGGRGVATQTVATDHVASVLLVRAWVGVIYNREIFGPPGCQPSVSPPVSHADGSVTKAYHNSDCSSADVRVNRDGSMVIQMVTEDGNRQVIRTQPSTPVSRDAPGSVRHEFDDGTVVGYQTLVNDGGTPDDHADDHVRADGQFVPVHGARQQFQFERQPDPNKPLVDQLNANIAGGGGLKMQFPVTLRPSAGTDLFTSGPLEPRLDLSRAIQGTYNAPGGDRLAFKMEGFHWTLTASGGITGSFQLQQGLEGAGNLSQNGRLVATVAWDRDGKGTVTVLNGDVWTIGPSAAALDFLNHRWRLLLPALGPSGSVASVQ
jgi:hypothetical protein